MGYLGEFEQLILFSVLELGHGAYGGAIRETIERRTGRVGSSGEAVYAACKGGMIAFTKAVAREMGSRSITANVVAPGLVRTELTEAIPQQIVDMAMERIFVGRLGKPEDIAACVAFLASE